MWIDKKRKMREEQENNFKIKKETQTRRCRDLKDNKRILKISLWQYS